MFVILFLAGCATVPTEYREPPPLTREERTAQNLRVFDRAWDLVNDRYFDEAFRGVDWPAMRERYRPQAAAAADAEALYKVVNQMCAELKESHLGALSPRRAHELETEHRPAIGIRWQLLEDQRVVVDVVPGGPADRAGIRRGWLVLKRNGTPLRDADTFITRLRDPVSFEFLDEHGAVRAFTLRPELLDFDRREVRPLEEGGFYLRFDRFDRSSLSWLSRQLKTHSTAPAVMIDLRSNRGGNTLVLDMAVAEFFKDRVAIGRLIRRSGRSKDVHSFAWLPAGYAGKVIVLTSQATASAAEIFTHVLQHYHRAVVIGQKTAGAVIYSRPYGLPDGGKIQVPIIDYVGLDGARLEGRGVGPDVEVPERSLADVRADRDPELARARELLRAK
ncbi:peptidase S41 [Opitutus terrae PB90-1]|uniref:Peptidase S41 n=1 Tax=Opitutus terrae (strain DSM 11246 / JCM 15787 / PB90-1) TaxID=452637 RepID=B1ZME2_OPITP|nr:peptidase S41 [Opitutus terrae PB90-1]